MLTSNDLASVGAVADRLLPFQDHYAAAATPFEWRFTRADLTRLLDRLTAADAPNQQRREPNWVTCTNLWASALGRLGAHLLEDE